jgi:hypothetical protein
MATGYLSPRSSRAVAGTDPKGDRAFGRQGRGGRAAGALSRIMGVATGHDTPPAATCAVGVG